MKKYILLFFLVSILSASSQDSLPKFTARVLNESKAQISWVNGFGAGCTQISVQRSYDSIRFFQTIFSSLSPELPQNGFVDNSYMQQLKIYYRIFYVLQDGSYFFTKSKTAKNLIIPVIENNKIKDSSVFNNIKDSSDYNTNSNSVTQIDIKLIDIPINAPKTVVKKIYSIYKRKTTHLAYVIDEFTFTKFKDSINNNTKDTLIQFDNEIVIWNPYIPPPAWRPSLNIYSNNTGNIELYIKEFKTKKYKVVFFDANNKELFKIKQINYSKLTLDKANFIKAGWYYFELYENDKLIEKNKFLVESDF